jgi:hypothetical protein
MYDLMKQNYVRKLLIAGTVSGSLLLSMGSMALANTQTPKTTPRIQASKQRQEHQKLFESTKDMTKAQAAEIRKTMPKQRSSCMPKQ